VIRFLDDYFYLIAVIVAAISYATIRLAIRSRRPVSSDRLPGMGTALVTGLVAGALLLAVSTVLNPLVALVNRERLFDYLWQPLLASALVSALAVLAVQALWPSGPRNTLGAVGRGTAGLVVGVGSLTVFGGAIGSAAQSERHAQQLQAEADEQEAIQARSAGLSILVTVADARFGGSSKYGGRIVSHLSLDIEVRSTTDVQLIPDEQNHWINLRPDTVSTIGVQPQERLRLPAHLPPGFDATYRLEVPIDELTWSEAPISGLEPSENFTSGPWTARLSMYGLHDAGTPQVIYTTTTTFDVLNPP